MTSSIHHNKASHIIVRVFILLTLPLLGYMLANALFLAYSEGSFVNWYSLGKPPSGFVKFIGGNPSVVWFEARDGYVYKGSISDCKKLQNTCWQKDENIDTSHRTERGFACESEFSNKKSLPADGVMCFIVVDKGEKWYGETHYAVSMDGRVWYWKHSIANLDSYGLISMRRAVLGGGIFVGLLTALTIFLYLQRPRKILIAS
jgi:hypothetical protein